MGDVKRGYHPVVVFVAFAATAVAVYAIVITMGNTAALLGFKRWAALLACVGTLLVLVVMFAVLAWFEGTRRVELRRRLREGLCLHCGFDLREARDLCPECGRPIDEHRYLYFGESDRSRALRAARPEWAHVRERPD